MICKKCGNNLEEKAKFCGVCGEKVEELQIPVNNEEIEEQNKEPKGVIEELSMVVPLIQPEPVQVEQTLEQTSIVEPIVPQENTISVNENVTSVKQAPEVITNNELVANKESKNKKNTWIFIVLGILLGIIAIVLVYFAYNKTSNNSVRVLEKALSNMAFKAENSGTIDTKLLIQSETEDSINLSGTLKYAKQGDDNYNINLTLNKSMFFDEMNIYASILDDKATLFINSSLIDLLGLTSSTPSMWVHMITTEQDLEMQSGTEIDEVEDIDLSDVLTENNFKLIDKQNDLNHYQLVIDNQLINKIKQEASKDEDLKDLANSLSELTETYYVDFYINNSNELVKISMDLKNSLDDKTIKSAVLSFEFNNFGSTTVEIPSEAKNSIIDLETYMATYAIKGDSIVTPSLNQDYTYQY